jgi:hypothetical protein
VELDDATERTACCLLGDVGALYLYCGVWEEGR